MADIGIVAQRRHATLERVLEALGMDLAIPSTKVDPIVTEAFYLQILEALAVKVLCLEVLAKRDEGWADLLGAVAAKGQVNEGSIEALAEAVNVLLNQHGPAKLAEASAPAGEATEA